MDAQSTGEPLKVCPRCAVASRTDSDRCPNCGREYRRRLWRWWFAIPIVALAFAGGYFGLSELVYDDDDEAAAVSEEEAAAVQPGATRADVEDELGAPEGEFANDSAGQAGEGAVVTCTYYELADQPERAWQFCFQGDVLATSEAVNLPAD